MACLLAGMASGTVIELEALQAASGNIQHQFTFEGTYNSADATGAWLDNKAAASPNLIQDGFEDPTRTANQGNPGYDISSSFADFSSFASGVKGDALKSSASITYATSGTIEYLVQFGAMDGGRYVINGDGSGTNDRLRFMATDSTGSKAIMLLGANVGFDLIGGTTSVAYGEGGDWYYVAQNWSISGGIVTLDAWVANLTAGGPLTKTIDGASNTFVGDTTTILNLGGAANTFADFGMDALAIYSSQLDINTITSHYNAVVLAVPEPVSVVKNISAACRHGQVFIQWNESAANGENLRVYMYDQPITTNNFALAQLVEQRIEPHSANDWYDDRDECPSVYTAAHGWILEDNGSPLNRQNGLFVHTVEEDDPANAYFAVLTDSQSEKSLVAGENAMTQAVAVAVGSIQPIWQWGADTVDWAAAQGRPLCIYLHPHTGKPTGGLNYLVFGDRSMGWREGLPFKFKVELGQTNGTDYVLVQPYNRMWINRKLSSSETYDSYNWDYKNIETWHFGASDKIYDKALRNTGTVVNYTQRLYLWMLDWVEQAYQTDKSLGVYAYGSSMGTGVQLLVMENPERFASVDARVPFLDYSYVDGDESNAKRLEGCCGPMWMPTSDGRTLSNRLNLVKFMQESTNDLPHVVIRVGRQDGSVYWRRKPAYMAAMQMHRRGFLAAWADVGHSEMSYSITNFPDFLDFNYSVRRFALNRSYPAFSNSSMNEDYGNGDKTDGDLVGFINYGLEWSGIVDEPNQYKVTIRSTLSDTIYPVTVDVTPRRLQYFRVHPGQIFRVVNRDGAGAIVEEKIAAVDSGGLLTYEAFAITSEQGNTMEVIGGSTGFLFELIGQQ